MIGSGDMIPHCSTNHPVIFNQQNSHSFFLGAS